MKSLAGGLIVLLGAAGLAAPLGAEISVNPQGKFLQLGNGWEQVRRGVASNYVLNPWGDHRGDGRPEVSISPRTGLPELVWASQEGDFEVRFARWTGERWATSLVTSNRVNDLNPRILHDRWGNRFILWQDGSGLRLSAAPADDSRFLASLEVSDSEHELLASDFAVDAEGRLVLTWYEARSTGTHLLAADLWPLRDRDGILAGGAGGPLPIPRVFLDISLGIDGPIPFGARTRRIPVDAESQQVGSVGLRASTFERADGGLLQSVAVGTEYLEIEASIFDPMIHVHQGEAWVDWVQGEQLRYQGLEGGVRHLSGRLVLRDLHPQSVAKGRDEVRRQLLRP